MKFSDRVAQSELAWQKWLDACGTGSGRAKLEEDAVLRVAFKAGVHMGIGIGEREPSVSGSDHG